MKKHDFQKTGVTVFLRESFCIFCTFF